MISVIVPTRNPNAGRLQRTLDGLAAQSLTRGRWELIVVDNGGSPALPDDHPPVARLGGRVVGEPIAGLTRARLRGLRESRGDVLVFVDDDNVLAPNFLEEAEKIFTRLTRLGAAGGPIRPQFESPPVEWTREFFPLLALRDLGAAELIGTGGPTASWPVYAPVGAGLCVRRAAAERYAAALDADPTRLSLDRAGRSLASGGDNDLVFTALRGGWDIGYFPALALTHLIPATRLATAYLARLNEGVQRTWVRVLAVHGACPWPTIPRWTVPLRYARAWYREAAWRSPAHRIRWRGLHGRFLGQADLARS
jgi:glycosyltransferase involved in cell wall biosynthesis